MPEIRDVRQIRLLASPVRQAIVDTLETSEALSAAELARILGYPADALYHHLRLLTRAGFLTCVGRTGKVGRPGAVFALRLKPTRLRYDPADHRNRKAVTAVVAGMLRDASRTFARGMLRHPVVAGRRRNLWAGRRTGWLTPSELQELNRLLHRIIRLMEQGAPGRKEARLYAMTFALSPFGSDRGLKRPVR